LASAATAYQAFAQNGWGAIIERTQEATQKQAGQATQLTQLNDFISFLAEANVARSQHLANFQGNVELWAEEHQKRVGYLEQQLLEARQETQRQAVALHQLAAQIRSRDSASPGSGIGSHHARTRSMAQSGPTIQVQFGQRPSTTPRRTHGR